MKVKKSLGIKKSATEETLQSIDGTLKRMEIILLDFQKKRNPLKAVQDAVEASISKMK